MSGARHGSAVDQWYEDLTADPIEHLTRALIGSILLSRTPQQTSDAFASLALEPDDFIDYRGRIVWQAMTNVLLAGHDLDITSIDIEMVRMGQSNAVGGAAYLGDCAMTVNMWQLHDETRDTIEGYAAQLFDASLGRRLVAKLSELTARAQRDILSGAAVLADTIADLETLEATAANTDSRAIPIGQVVAEAYIEMQDLAARREAGDVRAVLAVPTGLASLDKALGGGCPLGVVTLIGARPSIGKSSLGMSIADAASLNCDFPVHCFSLEDQKRVYALRLIAQRTRIAGASIRDMQMDAAQFERVDAMVGETRIRPGWLCCFDRGLTMCEILRAAKRSKRDNGTRCIVIDYLKLVNHKNPRYDLKQRIGENLKMAADVAGDLDVAMIILTQLNRDNAKRTEDRRPRDSDFADSGDQEQFSKVMIGIHRGAHGGFDPVEGVDYDHGAPKPTDDEFQKMAQLCLIKNSAGETGTIKTYWEGSTYRFTDEVPETRLALW